jgi:hypothetical protein
MPKVYTMYGRTPVAKKLVSLPNVNSRRLKLHSQILSMMGISLSVRVQFENIVPMGEHRQVENQLRRSLFRCQT